MSTILLLIMGKSCKRYSFVRLIIRTTIKNLKPVRIEVLESFVFGRNCELSILIDASKLQAKRTMSFCFDKAFNGRFNFQPLNMKIICKRQIFPTGPNSNDNIHNL
ncbi:hypothetical protein T10_8394 [Trichinella papuae]|uniref:Uncharacterized protein n=1 Tax=Trichinella papuae TaxID=268474 RepID=A0A0V1M506_9BILA|nr:hypothetical protein T10_8394 [Trichinella papuae]